LEAVNDNVFNPRDQVSIDAYFSEVLLIEVFLEIREAEGVAFLMHAVGSLFLVLEALVGQVHDQVALFNLVIHTARPEVALSIKINLVSVRH